MIKHRFKESDDSVKKFIALGDELGKNDATQEHGASDVPANLTSLYSYPPTVREMRAFAEGYLPHVKGEYRSSERARFERFVSAVQEAYSMYGISVARKGTGHPASNSSEGFHQETINNYERHFFGRRDPVEDR